jgi:2'-5' RNA ligase
MSSNQTMLLQERYEEMWTRALPQIRSGTVETDAVLASGKPDLRRGYTLMARPDTAVTAAAVELLNTLRTVEPNQYYYRPSEFHITCLSLFTATINHDPLTRRLEEYRAAVDEAVRGVPAFRVEFRGITASSGAVLIQGFPDSSTLEALRERLRTALHARDLTEGLDTRYRLMTAHMTVARFRAPLQDGVAFADLLERNREKFFGISAISELHLVMNDWYMSETAQRLLTTYRLQPE